MMLTIELPDRDTVAELAKLAKKNSVAHAEYARNPLISRRKASSLRHLAEAERWGRLEEACAKALAIATPVEQDASAEQDGRHIVAVGG